ncbi:hypothetical protein [Azospirillum halopraeferens]|uniref:hypothetical protein n=1 Tax=Azospirillum halopraeferens TaxID=34010 RepID=UPI00048F43C3|nr:hypothetical protein [Azospirillum halopraeferens]
MTQQLHRSGTVRPLSDDDRRRTLQYFERLGKDRVRLYAAVDCDRFLGNWQVRELADAWLAEKDEEERAAPFWRRLPWRR